MKKFYFLAALVAGTALTSCTSEDDLALSPPEVNVEDSYAPIVFSSVKNNITRGDITGKDAADLLGKKFVVFGYKGTTTGTPGSTVFDNYFVEYTENTANTTESNSSNWEYVDKTPIKHATDNGITKQTIKYWDYSKTQYDFIAWSTGSKTAIYEKPSTGIPSGQVYVSAIIPQAATSPATGLGQAYTFEGEAEDLKECYIADLMTVYKGNVAGTAPFYNVVANGYQQPVTLKFRQLGTKVRIGIYETVPGYSVKKVQFYSAAAVDTIKKTDIDPATGQAYGEDGAIAANASAKIFTTVANGIYKEGKYIVTFPTVDQPTNADNNQAHIDFEAKTGAEQKTTVDWGGLDYTFRESGEKSTDAIYLGRSSNTASFAGNAADNYYVVYLPNQNGTNLNLRVNFTLESIDGSKEEIIVKGATAQVPSIYTTWKPGYAYTYLFKISDKTNGHTGEYNPLYPDDLTINSDPAGLYPITFDAVVVNAEEDATQETITTISTPSITTYQKGSNVVNQNEYDHATGAIFVTVNDGNTAYVEVNDLTAGTSLDGYYTKGTEDVYTKCEASATAVDGTTYYSTTDGTTYTEVTGLTAGTSPVDNYYTKSTKDVYTPATGVAAASTTYYRMTPVVENGAVVTLTETGDGKAALYTLPTNKAYTEADVISALQTQEDDAATGTIKGRSGLVLTPADFSLVTSIDYGVDGNTIDLTKIPAGSSTYSANAMKFTADNAGTYAFVYTKKASTADTKIYQPVTKTEGAVVGDNVYRYALKQGEAGDVKKGVTYFAKNDGSEGSITAFLGQNVSNLYLDDHGTQQASGYAETGTEYWYTTNGQTFNKAHNVAFADYASTTLYKDAECTEAFTTAEKGDRPADGTAYYWKDTNDKIYYCVFEPQRAENLYVINTNEAEIVECTYTDDNDDTNDEKAVKGMIYLDMYTQNNGVYYTKVIKVQ